jgi:hypothetical protein
MQNLQILLGHGGWFAHCHPVSNGTIKKQPQDIVLKILTQSWGTENLSGSFFLEKFLAPPKGIKC